MMAHTEIHSARQWSPRTGLAPSLSAVAAIVVTLLTIGCAKDPVRPALDPVQWGTGVIDIALAWSQDGQWIAFRRMVPSSYGPPGMYVVHRTGAQVQFVCEPADLFFPREASFSPDGRYIAAVDFGRRLMIVDRATLEVRHPISTLGDVHSPEWSPDGSTILFSQFYSGNPSTTNDSLGLFLLDLSSGITRPLRRGSDPILSFFPRWSPDGKQIAMDEIVAPFRALSVMNADGSGHRFLIPPRSSQLYSDIDWFISPSGGRTRILFWNSTGPAVGPNLINLDGTELTPFWHSMQSEAFLSPTGKEYVRRSPDPISHHLVLFVGEVGDVTDIARRQVTSYELLPIQAAKMNED